MKRLILIPLLLCTLVSCTKFGTAGRDGKIKVFVTAGDTKGTVTTTDGLKESGTFSMMACLSDDYYDDETQSTIELSDGLYFKDNGNVNLTSSGWSISGEPKWVADVESHFWAWHPVTVPSRGNITAVMDPDPDPENDPKYPFTGELTFDYITPAPTAGQGDADAAVDLLFAYSKKNFNGKNGEAIDITFHHALSQVRFCVSTDDGTFDKSLIIKRISISNLAASGHCSFTDSGNAESNNFAYDPSNGSYDKFVWTGQTASKTFSQDYNADFSTSTVSGWTKGSYTKDSHTYNLFTCRNVFFMIPQTVTQTNMMTIVFEYNGVETTKSVKIADTTGDEWMGDHYYTYKIKATTVGRDIDFSVSLVGWTNRKDEIFI